MAASERFPPAPKFPSQNEPRVWLITCANSPIGVSLCKQLLLHGDYIVAGVQAQEFEQEEARSEDFREFLEEINAGLWDPVNDTENPDDDASSTTSTKVKVEGEQVEKKLLTNRFRVVALDYRAIGECQSTVAEAVRCFQRIDVLFCCHSEVLIGTVEEVSCSPRNISIVRDQFEANFFGHVNVIKATLPVMRARRNGHIIILSAITSHLGTPGLSIYCASQWATEGYASSLTYEVAPFNIKVTIVQPNLEVNVLTNRITSVPLLSHYAKKNNPAPLSRNILSSLLDRIEGTQEPVTGDQLYSDQVASLYAPLGKGLKERLCMETVLAVTAIGGHDNPPSRLIVGDEGITTVKEKLRTVSEELEEFAQYSVIVDIDKDETRPDETP